MKIASILPYKENYTVKGAGAVSLWVNDFMKFSKFKNEIMVFGNTQEKNYLSKNYTNIKINKINSKFYSSTKEYINKIFLYLDKNKFDIIEIHNRPIMLDRFIANIGSKIILYFHNDPRTMKGAKTPNERLFLLEKADKIIFISNWVKKKFFENLNFKDHNKTEIIYHSVSPLKKIKKKKNQIIFVGKLNEAKGYDLFSDAVSDVLDKYNNWKAFSIGDEKRFSPFKTHKKHLNLGLLSNKRTLDMFEKSEIAVVPSRWEEPFGRTALESSSRGCATIISKKGGLPETTNYALILNKLNSSSIKSAIIKLIKNKVLRKHLQNKGLQNVKHKLNINSNKIDIMRLSLFPFSYFNTNNKKLRILNIYNLAQKLNHRIYNLSLGKKFTNGFIRNGHDVIEISDRDYVRQNRSINLIDFKDKFHDYLIKTSKNYNPNLIIFGHTNNLNENILSDLRNSNKNVIISQWNEDPLMHNSSDSNSNINKVKNFLSSVDHSFITTDPKSIFLSKNKNDSINFFVTPVDKGIECFDVYKLKPKNDIFYALSHGVNRAKLKAGKIDTRIFFLNKLINKIKEIKYDFYGLNNKEPIWGNEFYKALINSKMALNLSRGIPTKHYSSNRIASLIGNGLLTFIDEKVCMNSFFNKNEIIFYKNIDDLADKIRFYSKNDKLRIKIARNGKQKYFKRFNEVNTTKYIIDICLSRVNKLYS